MERCLISCPPSLLACKVRSYFSVGRAGNVFVGERSCVHFYFGNNVLIGGDPMPQDVKRSGHAFSTVPVSVVFSPKSTSSSSPPSPPQSRPTIIMSFCLENCTRSLIGFDAFCTDRRVVRACLSVCLSSPWSSFFPPRTDLALTAGGEILRYPLCRVR